MKKTYRRPTLTAHGGATEKTENRNRGDFYDSIGYRWVPANR